MISFIGFFVESSAFSSNAIFVAADIMVLLGGLQDPPGGSKCSAVLLSSELDGLRENWEVGRLENDRA